MTQALWDEGKLEAAKEPAGNINLHLFEARPRNDLLVVYNEYSERNDVVLTRAYWLNKNQERINQRHAPDFVNTNLTSSLLSVPVFYLSPVRTNSPESLYAVVEKDRQSFSLYSGDRKISSHDLPIYNDGKGRYEKIALTPFAVSADITIVGCILGYWYVCALANTYNPSY